MSIEIEADDETRAAGAGPQHGETLVGVAVLLTALVAGAWLFQPREMANSETRMALVRAIVDDGTLSIDRYEQRTIDKALVDGHYYCDKAPGASFWGVPAYWLAKQIAWLARQPLSEQVGRYLTRLWVSTLPTAVTAWLIWRLLCGLSLSAWSAAAVATCYALGTCAWPYATAIYGHQLAAMFGTVAVVAVVGRDGAPAPGFGRALVAGVAIGLGVLTEYPLAILGAILAGYLTWAARPRWTIVGYLLGGLPAAIALGAYNAAIFGSPWATGYGFEATAEFQEGMATGVAGVGGFQLGSLWLITGSLARGLFTTSPWLLLAAPGLWLAWRRAPRRAPWLIAALISAAFLVFNASYYMPDGGTACGPRHLLPALPWVSLLVGGVLLPGCSPWWRVALVGLAVPAIVRHGVATAIDPHVDPRMTNPWLDYWAPLWAYDYHAVTPITRLGASAGASLAVLVLALGVIWGMAFAARPEASTANGSSQGKLAPWRGARGAALVVALSLPWLMLHLAFRSPGPLQPLVRGGMLYNHGLHEEARQEFHAALRMPIESELDRKCQSLSWYTLGMMAAQRQRLDEAVASFREAIALDTENANLRFEIGVALYQQGNVDAARQAFEEALAIDPDFEPAREALTQLEGQQGQRKGTRLGAP